MRFAIDLDDTLVEQEHPYDDFTSPLKLKPGAREALLALKRSGHVLLLFSARASRALLFDPDLDPLVRAGARKVDRAKWQAQLPIHWGRYRQMIEFVAQELPGIFDAIDDGAQGKPSVDYFIDDKSIRFGAGFGGVSWPQIAKLYGASAAPLVGAK